MPEKALQYSVRLNFSPVTNVCLSIDTCDMLMHDLMTVLPILRLIDLECTRRPIIKKKHTRTLFFVHRLLSILKLLSTVSM